MKAILIYLFIAFVLLCFCLPTFAQQQSKEEYITSKLNEYFFLERENIHVHTDKDVFISEEEVWFKGYVFHRKRNTPFFATVNIFANLINQNGDILETQLLYSDKGSFSGKFKISSTLGSGKYYLRFYTNWMNNFTEDESSIYEITVINTNDSTHPSQNNGIPLQIIVKPEGGTILKGTQNAIAIAIADCSNKPIAIDEAELIDSKGKIVIKVPINKHGYGKFTYNGADDLKIAVTANGMKYEKTLPHIEPEGVSCEVDTYSLENKTILKLRTNKQSLYSIASGPVYVVVHKDDKSVIFETTFNEGNLEQVLNIHNGILFEGLNTIRILDSNLTQLSERLIYIYPQTTLNSQLSILKNDSTQIEFSGKVNAPNMNLSISILPEKTISRKETNNIFSDLSLLPYIKNRQKFPDSINLNTPAESNKHDLDLFLLCQEAKYNWDEIRSNQPKENYTFDAGLSLKGSIPDRIDSPGSYKLRIHAISELIDETVPINNQKEFQLDNLIISDSTKLSFDLIKDGKKVKDLILFPKIYNSARMYNKPFIPETTLCKVSLDNVQDTISIPKYRDKSIKLEEIKISKKQPKLKFAKITGNYQLFGYKITIAEARGFPTILDLIRYHGFEVRNRPDSSIAIYGRIRTTFVKGLKNTPLLYIDDVRNINFDILRDMKTEDVEEFYVNRHAVVPGVNNNLGIIKIYMKKDFSDRDKEVRKSNYIVKGGFKKIEPYQNPYKSYDDEGFENFGVINWLPYIKTDDNGNLKFSIPRLYEGTIQVIIEGISPDGKMISEVKTISL